jgi:hypothetical protein
MAQSIAEYSGSICFVFMVLSFMGFFSPQAHKHNVTHGLGKKKDISEEQWF